MLDISFVWEILKGRRPHQIARISAYLVAPGLVLAWTISGVNGRPLAIWLEWPVAISELKTEIGANGSLVSKRGIALIVEPVESEYRIPLGLGGSRIWSSLDEETIRSNRDHLVLNGGGLSNKTPYLGVNGPVAVVVEGELGTEIQVPGGSEPVDDWRLPSRRSLSIVSSVLLACVFAFGISLATGLPPSREDENTAS